MDEVPKPPNPRRNSRQVELEQGLRIEGLAVSAIWGLCFQSSRNVDVKK